MKKCKYCQNEYENIYKKTKNDKVYSYSVETKFCSKSCKTSYQRGSLNKKVIEEEIVNFVMSVNTYCSKQDILDGIKRSSKTIVKYGISIKKIQDLLGLTKPKSIFQEKIYTELKKIYSNIECEKTFSILKSPKGFPLFIDFFIKDFNIIIEADGTQHVDALNPWFSKYNVECDNIKNQYAKSNSINMVRIPYTKKVTENYVRGYFQDFM